MDRSYLQSVADYQVRVWWNRFLKVYPQIQTEYPQVKLNNRLKSTAGRAFIENDPQYIDLCTELFWQYTEQFVEDTIPHELAHLVAFTVYGDPGHGSGWKTVIHKMNISTNRCHTMVNQMRNNK